MSTWLERFVITILAALVVAIAISNPFGWDSTVKWSVIASVVVLSIGIGYLVERLRSRGSATAKPIHQANSGEGFSDGSGGKGGGGNAFGKNSKVIGGTGGRGGAFGRGGDGGGGDAVGDGSVVVGGDGGDAGRIDGRGGKGARSPLKKLPPETLAAFGLTGNEGYGQGGSAANSPEYDRRLRVLCRLSIEFDAAFPRVAMQPMPGVLMPPEAWVNQKLVNMKETFRVGFIDNGTDFLLHDIK